MSTNHCGWRHLSNFCDFHATAAGSQSDFVIVNDDAASTPQTVALSGVGVVPMLTISPAAGGSTTATVSSGQPTTYNLSIKAGTGVSGTIGIVCIGAPAKATCTVNPSSLVIPDGGTLPFTVVVATQSSASASIIRRSYIDRAGLGIFASLTVILLFGHRKRVRTRFNTLILILMGVLTYMLVGCGGGVVVATSNGNATPPGIYALSVTATKGAVF